MNFPCATCGARTTYRMYSGGNEYTCDNGHEGTYPATGKHLPRATMLRTPEGTAALREAMREELAKRHPKEQP